VVLAEKNPAGRVSDAALHSAGIDPVRLRRHAQRVHGVTFHAWCRLRLIARAQRRLQDGASVDRVILESGYDSHSGFRDAFTRVTGRTPGRAKTSEPIAITCLDSPVGPLVTGAIAEGVCLLEFGDRQRVEQQAQRLARRFGGPLVSEDHPHLRQLAAELSQYWSGLRRSFTVPLAVRGTPFEEATWQALREVPWGETRSYGDIAVAIGNPGAVRAVGSANGRNRIAIVIPCHRVVNADGKLGGYGGGLWRKRRLLELEQG
jgi:AraC family transcriptional regulator of adaptative response/methylated-DNA-[protein]-cysteine methyltransferase